MRLPSRSSNVSKPLLIFPGWNERFSSSGNRAMHSTRAIDDARATRHSFSTTARPSQRAHRTTVIFWLERSRISCRDSGICVDIPSSAGLVGIATAFRSKHSRRKRSACQAPGKSWSAAWTFSTSSVEGWFRPTSPSGEEPFREWDVGSISTTTTRRWTSTTWSRCGGSLSSSGKRTGSTRATGSCLIPASWRRRSPTSRQTRTTRMFRIRRSRFDCASSKGRSRSRPTWATTRRST